MTFDLNKCVNYISTNKIKRISEAFGKWLEDDNITRTQWIALYFIYTRKELSQRELANLMESNDSSTLRLVDRLEREKWVERTRSKSDRRVINVSLTHEGNGLIERLLPIGSEFNQVLVRDIDPNELGIFLKVQQQMFNNVMSDSRTKNK